jgi:ATP-dependent RNA helicase DeaD
MDMLGRGALKLNELRWAVLDEVDRMLDIGFRDDIRYILGLIRNRVQTMFVSATLPDDVNRLVEQYSHDLKRVTLSSDRLTVEHVKQFYVSVEGWDKYRMLRKLLAAEQPELAIIFTNTRHQTGRVCERLQDDGISALHIHGDLLQKQRDRVMQSFREQRIHVLVATDLVGRGIDVDGITHIINYDMPFDAELYVHRIGRTARMGAVGVAISLVTPEEGPELTEIEKLINVQLQPMQVAGFSASPPPPMEFARRQAEEQADQARKAAPPVRAKDPVFADDEFKEQHGLPPKTLGSKFKTPQRRKTKKLKRR